MTPEQFQRIEELFERACMLPVEGRSAFLRERCGDDSQALRMVEQMLAKDEGGAEYLEAPALGQGFHVGGTDEIERRLKEEIESAGRYRLLDPVGEGGFGTVYKAEQLQPVRRTVALKVIKLGMDTKRTLARFEAERQALALMEHPAIARVYDAGATAVGRPYFAMEFVSGMPITKYCDAKRLPAKDRLLLFMEVASAVQYAHQKGIIHRDIKPSNVIVGHSGAPELPASEARATPKLIDFGIARAMDDSTGGRTLVTEQGQMIGTPEYMSPEQADGSVDIDTRTDIYSLGVLLYELLIGMTPFDRDMLAGAGQAQIQRVICEHMPLTPSARLRTLGEKATAVAELRHTDLLTLGKSLRGDLDWIIMKAIEKDRARRYETADSFIADLRRYLNNELVLARPPTAAYRFRKFARRNRGTLAAGVAIFVLLVAGMIGTSVGLLRARREARIARAVSDFLNKDLLTAMPDRSKGRELTMKETLDVASQKMEGKFADQPAVEIAIRNSLGQAYIYLGEYDTAKSHLDRAVVLARSPSTDDTPLARIEALFILAKLYVDRNWQKEAEPLLKEVLPQAIRLQGESGSYPLMILNDLAIVYKRLGRMQEAEQIYQRIIRIRRGIGDDPANQLDLLITMCNLGTMYVIQDRVVEAQPILTEVLEEGTRQLGPEHAVTMRATLDVASILLQQKKLAESEAKLVPLLALIQKKLGEHHPYAYFVTDRLAELREVQGRTDEAFTLRQRTIEIAQTAFGEGNDLFQSAITDMAALCDTMQRPDDAAKWRAKLKNVPTPTTNTAK